MDPQGRQRVVVLDDYQSVALRSADWTAVRARYDIDVVTDHIAEPTTLVERLQGATVVVAMRERTSFPHAVLARLPDLHLLVTAGMKNAAIDLTAAAQFGITVCGTGGLVTPVPEIAFGMMIALARGFVAEDAAVRAGGWQHTIGPGLAGRTLGLVGLGRLGTAMVPIARVFGMDVIAWSPHLTAERAAASGAAAVSREDLFGLADYVSIHMVLSDRTRGLVTAVDQVALVAALTEGRIGGAALDVFGVEPLPAGDPWRSAPRTLLLPHLGYVTTESYATFYGDAVEDIVAFDAGSPVRVLTI